MPKSNFTEKPTAEVIGDKVHLYDGNTGKTVIADLPPTFDRMNPELIQDEGGNYRDAVGTYHGNSKRTPELDAWIKIWVRQGATYKSIAAAIGVTEMTLFNWFNRTPKFKYELELERRKRITDKAVGNIEKSILEGDAQNSKWWLQHVERKTFHTKLEEDREEENSNDILIIQPNEIEDDEPTLEIEESGVPSDEETVASTGAFDGQQDY